MTNVRNDPILQMETTCGTLLHELQVFALHSHLFVIFCCYFKDFSNSLFFFFLIVNEASIFGKFHLAEMLSCPIFINVRSFGMKLGNLRPQGTKCCLRLNKSA